MSDLKWINYSQNNSGGYIIQNKEVSELVCIQGEGLEQIKSKAESLFADYCEYCERCGERWIMWVDESDLEFEPTCYGESIKDSLSLFHKRGYATLHFHNGDVRYVKKHEGDYVELEVINEGY